MLSAPGYKLKVCGDAIVVVFCMLNSKKLKIGTLSRESPTAIMRRTRDLLVKRMRVCVFVWWWNCKLLHFFGV